MTGTRAAVEPAQPAAGSKRYVGSNRSWRRTRSSPVASNAIMQGSASSAAQVMSMGPRRARNFGAGWCSSRIDDTRRGPLTPADRNLKITGFPGSGAQTRIRLHRGTPA